MTKQERAMNTRHALIRSAAHAFDQFGYTRAKLAGISAGAGVSSGALHFHFDTKAAMAAAVESEAARTLHALTRHARLRSPSPLQGLIDSSHVIAQQLRWDVVVRAGFHLNCRTAHHSEVNLRQEWLECVRHTLARSAVYGQMPQQAVQEELTATVVGATAGFEALARHDRNWLSRQTVTGLWHTLLPQLATPKALVQLQPAGTEAVLNATVPAAVPPPVAHPAPALSG
ncbi:ScbR family autoregulator-binding transcription factor [Streptomyces sp. NPDC008001]|uniref:ScbR family autoregulator-binding transcription factor n=1 Tax=Streptomyces sp. NPDC008001 TaxID=3364804 RepID=UPI0036EAB00E